MTETTVQPSPDNHIRLNRLFAELNWPAAPERPAFSGYAGSPHGKPAARKLRAEYDSDNVATSFFAIWCIQDLVAEVCRTPINEIISSL